jgi:hypothetical protein
LYQGTAEKLTIWENHKTETQYNGKCGGACSLIFLDALIAKRFVFNFVNSFASLFYIGLIKERGGNNIVGVSGWNDRCGADSCLVDLMIQLSIIFVGRQLIGQIQEVFIP